MPMVTCWTAEWMCVLSTKCHLFYRMRGWWGQWRLERNESTANAASTSSIKYLEAHRPEKSACCGEAALHADFPECKFSSISRHTCSHSLCISCHPAGFTCFSSAGIWWREMLACTETRSNPSRARRLELLTQIKAEPKHTVWLRN